MTFIDSHSHLYLNDFDTDGGGEGAVNRAVNAGVERIMFPNVDISTIEPMKQLAHLFPKNIDMAMGLHPTEVTPNWLNDMATIECELASNNYQAVGEVGIDLYWDTVYRQEQIEVFEKQCRLALDLNLPMIIHCRKGLKEVLETFDRLGVAPMSVFHSFGGTIADVENIRRRGDFYFGINGIVTFKNSGLRDVLPVIGLDRILLETDSPYLAPVPMRGQRNESAYIVHTAEHVAHALNVTCNEVASTTTQNYMNFINRDKQSTNK